MILRVRVHPREASECQILDSFQTLLRLWGALFRDSGGPRLETLSGLFSNSSRVAGPKGAGEPFTLQGGRNLVY